MSYAGFFELTQTGGGGGNREKPGATVELAPHPRIACGLAVELFARHDWEARVRRW